MPLLLCPNDNSSMTTVERSGVQFDMCPTCRGVWLDRGELEKLMDAERADGLQEPLGSPMEGPRDRSGAAFRPRTYPSDPRYDDERGEYGERGERGERGDYGHQRRRSIFDIFD